MTLHDFVHLREEVATHSMVPGDQVTAELRFFLHSSHLGVSDDSDSPVVMRCIPF